MSITLTRGLAVAALGLTSLAAHAAGRDTYLDLRLLGTVDGGGLRQDSTEGQVAASVDDGLGWGLRGAWEFAPRWHLYGEWGVSNASLDVSVRVGSGNTIASNDADFDMTRASLGLGYAWPAGDDWEIYGRVTWDYIEYGDFDAVDLAGIGRVEIGDEDDNGVGATFGARWFSNAWELEAWGRYTQVGELADDGGSAEFDNDFGGGARAVYHFGQNWSAGADYEFADIDTWSAFVRYRF